MSARPANLHATCIAVAGLGLLIRGPARSGKSALALSTLRRAEAAGLEAALVSDDQVFVEPAGARLEAFAPAAIGGLIEISGVGILPETSVSRATLGLVVDLLEPSAIERLPEARTVRIEGVEIRRVTLPAREAAFGADILVSLAKRASESDLNQF